MIGSKWKQLPSSVFYTNSLPAIFQFCKDIFNTSKDFLTEYFYYLLLCDYVGDHKDNGINDDDDADDDDGKDYTMTIKNVLDPVQQENQQDNNWLDFIHNILHYFVMDLLCFLENYSIKKYVLMPLFHKHRKWRCLLLYRKITPFFKFLVYCKGFLRQENAAFFSSLLYLLSQSSSFLFS